MNPLSKQALNDIRVLDFTLMLGEHTEEILRDLLAYGTEDIQHLKDEGVI